MRGSWSSASGGGTSPSAAPWGPIGSSCSASFFCESLPLAVLGFLLGLLLTAWAWDVFVALLPPSVVHLTGLGLDGGVVALTALVSLLALVLVDLLPFLEIARISLLLLGQGSARTGESPASRRGRNTLVAAEIALTLALLIGAGLLMRSLARLSRVDLGFRPERVLALDLDLSSSASSEPRRAGSSSPPSCAPWRDGGTSAPRRSSTSLFGREAT